MSDDLASREPLRRDDDLDNQDATVDHEDVVKQLATAISSQPDRLVEVMEDLLGEYKYIRDIHDKDRPLALKMLTKVIVRVHALLQTNVSVLPRRFYDELQRIYGVLCNYKRDLTAEQPPGSSRRAALSKLHGLAQPHSAVVGVGNPDIDSMGVDDRFRDRLLRNQLEEHAEAATATVPPPTTARWSSRYATEASTVEWQRTFRSLWNDPRLQDAFVLETVEGLLMPIALRSSTAGERGETLVLAGPADSGKTHVLSEIRRTLRARCGMGDNDLTWYTNNVLSFPDRARELLRSEDGERMSLTSNRRNHRRVGGGVQDARDDIDDGRAWTVFVVEKLTQEILLEWCNEPWFTLWLDYVHSLPRCRFVVCCSCGSDDAEDDDNNSVLSNTCLRGTSVIRFASPSEHTLYHHIKFLVGELMSTAGPTLPMNRCPILHQWADVASLCDRLHSRRRSISYVSRVFDGAIALCRRGMLQENAMYAMPHPSQKDTKIIRPRNSVCVEALVASSPTQQPFEYQVLRQVDDQYVEITLHDGSVRRYWNIQLLDRVRSVEFGRLRNVYMETRAHGNTRSEGGGHERSSSSPPPSLPVREGSTRIVLEFASTQARMPACIRTSFLPLCEGALCGWLSLKLESGGVTGGDRDTIETLLTPDSLAPFPRNTLDRWFSTGDRAFRVEDHCWCPSGRVNNEARTRRYCVYVPHACKELCVSYGQRRSEVLPMKGLRAQKISDVLQKLTNLRTSVLCLATHDGLAVHVEATSLLEQGGSSLRYRVRWQNAAAQKHARGGEHGGTREDEGGGRSPRIPLEEPRVYPSVRPALDFFSHVDWRWYAITNESDVDILQENFPNDYRHLDRDHPSTWMLKRLKQVEHAQALERTYSSECKMYLRLYCAALKLRRRMKVSLDRESRVRLNGMLIDLRNHVDFLLALVDPYDGESATDDRDDAADASVRGYSISQSHRLYHHYRGGRRGDDVGDDVGDDDREHSVEVAAAAGPSASPTANEEDTLEVSDATFATGADWRRDGMLFCMSTRYLSAMYDICVQNLVSPTALDCGKDLVRMWMRMRRMRASPDEAGTLSHVYVETRVDGAQWDSLRAMGTTTNHPAPADTTLHRKLGLMHAAQNAQRLDEYVRRCERSLFHLGVQSANHIGVRTDTDAIEWWDFPSPAQLQHERRSVDWNTHSRLPSTTHDDGGGGRPTWRRHAGTDVEDAPTTTSSPLFTVVQEGGGRQQRPPTRQRSRNGVSRAPHDMLSLMGALRGNPLGWARMVQELPTPGGRMLALALQIASMRRTSPSVACDIREVCAHLLYEPVLHADDDTSSKDDRRAADRPHLALNDLLCDRRSKHTLLRAYRRVSGASVDNDDDAAETADDACRLLRPLQKSTSIRSSKVGTSNAAVHMVDPRFYEQIVVLGLDCQHLRDVDAQFQDDEANHGATGSKDEDAFGWGGS